MILEKSMKFLTSFLFIGLFSTAVFSQSTQPKPAASKPKANTDKTKSAQTKPKTAASKSKTNTEIPKSGQGKPKPSATPAKRPGEKDEWEKAIAITDVNARIAALKKFVAAFPRTNRKAEASQLISTAEASLGNEKFSAGETDEGAKLFKAAAKDAPKPVPEQLFTETLSKLPANLYFRGLRDAGLEIARTLEGKAETNANQLLTIANFYLSVENGAEARRVAENVIKIEPNSASAYRTLGLANRVDFRLEESATAYAKALELEPDSLSARRGLAEMKRSLGLADEAIGLYREILAKDETNLPARTGLILALFDGDKRADAEAEMGRSLEANPGNVILLAGAAYWYAAHNEGARAVDFARQAIDADPRFIWSHIAFARGLLSQNKAADAERTLLGARQYGNFPTLEYEIASARLNAGLFREAAEELLKSFSVKDGSIHTNLGGRVAADANNFTDLIAAERKASLFTPTAADNAEDAALLKALLEFNQEIKLPEPKSEVARIAADNFLRGDDKMKVHRQLFVASELLEKKIALPKVMEIVKAAPSHLDAGLEVVDPATAVMASELYENRSLAAARGQFINVPNVPRSTLSAVLRGRIEEIAGWASFQMDEAALAVLHLKRAVGVLPVDSAWWRSSNWRLGTALAITGNDAEALEAYIKSYKSSGPDAIRYGMIEALYKRVKGNTVGLEDRIGPNPAVPPQVETVAKIEPTPDGLAIPTKSEPPDTLPQASPTVESSVESTATPTARVDSTPDASPTPILNLNPDAETTPEAEPVKFSTEKKPSAAPTVLFPPVVITIPAAETSKNGIKTTVVSAPSPTVDNKPSEALISTPSPTQSPTIDAKPSEPSPTAIASPEISPNDSPTVVLPTPQPTPEIKPCTLIVDIDNITIKSSEGVLAVIVRRDGDGELEELKAVSSSPEDVAVRRELIEGLKTQALFVLRSTSAKTGVYPVAFEMPCGKKEITVKVQ